MAKGRKGTTVFSLRTRDMSHVKPEGCEDYFTLTELCRHLHRDGSGIRKLEAEGRIPKAHRVEMGKLSVRLWSPKQVKEIEEILSKMKPGRPVGS